MSMIKEWEPNGYNIPSGNWFHDEVFHSVSTDLGLLSKAEATAVTQFYSHGKYASDYAENLIQRPYSSQESIDILHTNIYEVQKNRKAAVILLNENLNGSIRHYLSYIILGSLRKPLLRLFG